MMTDRYTCDCGKSAPYGEVHGCWKRGDHFVLYLNREMKPFFITSEVPEIPPPKVDYGTTDAPDDYVCKDCGAQGCKLWRQYNTFLNHIELVCCECAGKREGKDVGGVDNEGRVPWTASSGCVVQWIVHIGDLIPAIPTTDGSTFWGLSSTPAEGWAWWRRLPTRMPRERR